MVHGENCPVCNSANVSDSDMHYTYDDPAKVVATWDCNDCNAIYSIIYEGKKMEIEKYIDYEDEWEESYEVDI